MPVLKIPHTFSGSPARDAVKRTHVEMDFLKAQPMPNPEALTDYFMGLLWIEGFKVVPLDAGDH